MIAFLNIDRYSTISVTRVNDIVGATALSRSLRSSPAWFWLVRLTCFLFLSFQPSFPSPFPVLHHRIVVFLSFSVARAGILALSFSAIDRTRSLSLFLFISPLPPPRACVRVGAWIGGWIGERTNADLQSVARVGSSFFLSACFTRAPWSYSS